MKNEVEMKEARVRVFDIEYDVSDEDIVDNGFDTKEELVDSLPKELDLTVQFYDETRDNLEEAITDAISEETGWCVWNYDYDIIYITEE